MGFGILISLWLLLTGYYTILGGLAIIILPAILYLAPRIAKVRGLKYMIANGTLFAVIALLIGGGFIVPDEVNERSTFKDGNGYKNAEITQTDAGYSITVDYSDYDDAITPVIFLGQVEMVEFFVPRGNGDSYTGTWSGNTASFDLTTDDKLYLIYFYMKDASDTPVRNSYSEFMYLTLKTSDSEYNSAVWKGVGYTVGTIMILYFMITIFTHLIRSRADVARDRMIEQGRLYPQGYGRCKQCDAIVLPGEINCLKCNAYIDVPKELRPYKVDYFECDKCGAEVPEDADKCSRCGVYFDGVEVEVQRADGTVEVIHETFDCPECRSNVPMSSKACPVCGKRFRK